ncbi:MFS transporter [Nocardia sp. XZ_19_385]|uniref:MFS transporter n=1 Tax=Nocardia sp. XZ_19_385 TaxID=2769488 RepID=UPI0028154C9C|nr:MFS transporter [Nocardia sp. XZ_19_385]
MTSEAELTGNQPETSAPDARPGSRKSLIAVGAGNAIEWFDVSCYASFAAFFAPLFFDGQDKVSSLLSTFGVFAVGFIARPIGGVVLGRLADRRGRSFAMLLAIGLSSFGSLVIGLAPVRESIGVLAAVLLVSARLMQGFAHGGEMPASQTYIAEVAPAHRRGMWSSLTYISGTFGVISAALLGAVLTTVLSADQMSAFGWRIPFLLGALLGGVAFYLRTNLEEPEAFTSRAGTVEPGTQVSLARNLYQHRRTLAVVVALTAGATAAYYSWGVSTPAYAISAYGVPAAGAMWAGALAKVVFLVALPLWGLYSDNVGRKPALVKATVALILLLFPLAWILQGGQSWQLFLTMGIALVFIAAANSIGPALFAEMLPTDVRAVGIGLPMSLGVAIFGGTAPFLQTLATSHGAPELFTGYTVLLLCVSLATLVFFVRETKGRDLSV